MIGTCLNRRKQARTGSSTCPAVGCAIATRARGRRSCCSTPGIAQLESWDAVTARLLDAGHPRRTSGPARLGPVDHRGRRLRPAGRRGRAARPARDRRGRSSSATRWAAFSPSTWRSNTPTGSLGVVGVGAGLSGFEADGHRRGDRDLRAVRAAWSRPTRRTRTPSPTSTSRSGSTARRSPKAVRRNGSGTPSSSGTARSTSPDTRWAVASRLDPPAAERLAELTCPVLAVAGTLDFGYVAPTARHLELNAPNARAVVWDDVAHMIGMEQPDRLADLDRGLRPTALRLKDPDDARHPDSRLTFAAAWVAAWNAHDVEAVLAHFAEDAVFTSPVATRVVPGSDGVLRGKAAIRDYWTTALRGLPDLRFEVLGTYAGVDTLVINYRNQRGGLVNEVLTFADGLVVHGRGTYLAAAAADVGAMDGPDLELTGDRVMLVPVRGDQVDDLRRIRRTPRSKAVGASRPTSRRGRSATRARRLHGPGRRRRPRADPVRRGGRAGLPARLDRPVPGPGGARPGHRARRRADDGPAPVRGPWAPADHHRPGRGQRGRDPVLRGRRLPAGRACCAATSATPTAGAGTTAC